MNEITIIQKPSTERISDLMRRLIDTAAQSESVAIGRILHICGMRGFAFLLLILSFLNIVIFMVPFLSFFLGLPMIILTAQMVMGLSAPIFPAVVRRRTISRGPLIDGVTRAAHWMEKLERYIKPRLLVLSSPQLMRLHAFFSLFMAVMVTLPIPVINVPPSVALALLSLGILERDGLFILAGYVVGIWCIWLFSSLGHLAL